MIEILELREILNNIKDGSDIFKKIKRIRNIDYQQENFIVFYLNTSNKVIKTEVLFKGGYDACLIDPKTIFRKTLIYKSSKIIIAHNHTSSNLTPSYEDKEVYDKLKEAGRTIDISVLDSIIFNKKEFFSLN